MRRPARVSLQRLLCWLVAVVVVLVPILPGSNSYIVSVVIRALLFIALGQSWNIIAGIGGQLSLGQGVFFGVGSYGTAMLFNNLGLTPWIGAVIAALAAGALALVLGLATLRFRGIYFGLATIVISLGFEQIARYLVAFTGGDSGLVEKYSGTSWYAAQSISPAPLLWASLVMVVVFYVLTRWILNSRFGLELQTVRDDEEAAAAAGVKVFQTKLLGFIVSGMMTAVAGALYIQFYLAIDPTTAFGLYEGILIQLPALLGGLGTAGGPIIGGALMILISEVTNTISGSLHISGLDVLVFGILLLLIILRLPGGILAGMSGRTLRGVVR